jgi:hypothetical protein
MNVRSLSQVKEVLMSQDEADLFRLANNFGPARSCSESNTASEQSP